MACPHKRSDKSQQDATELNRPLVKPKNIIELGNWNVRTLYRSGNIAQGTREMTSRNIDIIGICETDWTGQEKMQQTEGETIIYSGRDDDNHKEGVGILMSRSASRTLMDWTPISERIIQARLYSQHTKLTIVHISLTEEADEQVKEEFYVVLHDVLDNRNKKDLLIITGDINAKVGEENLDY